MAIDAHLHLFRDEDEGLVAQGGTRQAGYAGVLAEVQAVIARGRITDVMAMSTLPVELWRRFLGPTWPAGEVEDRLLARAIEQNTWLCGAVAADAHVHPVIGADATLPGKPFLQHLEQTVARHAVRAMKVHPALNFIPPDHPGYAPVYELAQQAGIVIISHGGASAPIYASETDFCAPKNFAPVLRSFPDLRLVIAHLGHPYEDDLLALAAEFPNLHTDLSWVLGAGLVDSVTIKRAVGAFGVERVLFGTDFPYYDPEASLQVLESNGLTAGEVEQIASGNAVRLFGLN